MDECALSTFLAPDPGSPLDLGNAQGMTDSA